MSEQAVETDFAFAIGNEIKKEMKTLLQATDWPDFKERKGKIQGMEKALGIHADLVKHLNEYDADDDDDDLS